MKSNWELKENSTGVLTVTIDGDAWLNAQTKAFDKVSKNVEVPGFRKGKAPKSAIKKHVNSQSVLFEAMNSSLQELYSFGLTQHQLRVVAQPEVDIKSLTELECTVEYKVTIAPEVTLAEDYKTLSFKPKRATVTAEEINHELEHLQKDYTEWNLKEEGEVESGNKVILDYEGFKDDVAFEGGKAENAELEIGSNTFIPGFEDQLIGVKAGESKELHLTFPEEYPAKELAGASVVFKTTVHEIREKALPELNDEFAKSVNEEGVETLEDLKAKIKERLQTSKREQNKLEADNQLVDAVVEGAKVEIPAVMIENETQQLLKEFEQRLAQQGLNFDVYKQILGQSQEDVLTQMRPDAEKRVKLRLVLEAIAKDQSIEATDEDVEKEYELIASTYQIELEQVKKMVDPSDLKYDVTVKKAHEALLSQNK